MTTPRPGDPCKLPVQRPGTPPREAERLAALHCIGLLDSAPSESFDRITRLGAQVLDVPVMLISLVDATRQWFKSRHGIDVAETPRAISFCAHAVYHRALLNVPDATADERFADNPLVTGPPHVRAYLGAPVYSRDGHALGTLCAVDMRPRHFTEQDVAALNTLAQIVEESIQAQEVAAATATVRHLAAERDKLFRDTFEQAAVGIVHTNLSGHLLRANQRIAQMLGYSKSELSAISFVDITYQDDLMSNVAMFNKMVAGALDSYSLEKRFIRNDGSLMWANISAALRRRESGEPDYIITVIEDIGARKQMEAELVAARDALQVELNRQTQALRQNDLELRANIKRGLDSERSARRIEYRMRSIADRVPAMIGYWNRDLICEFANESYRVHFNLSPQQIVGMSMAALLGEMMFETVEPLARRVLEGQAQRFERQLAMPDGSEAVIEVHYTPDLQEAPVIRGFFVLATDVTEARKARHALEAANTRLTKETVTDFLTDVSNRRVFSERGEEASRRFHRAGESYGLILMDLDNFKHINDTYGHDAGDEVLRVVGSLLKGELRSHRDIAARLGGEEFAILCFGEVDAEILGLIAERLRSLMSRKLVQTAKGSLNFTSSFGLAISNPADSGWKTIYARADSALYEAKAAGKDRVRFGADHTPAATGKFRALRTAAGD